MPKTVKKTTKKEVKKEVKVKAVEPTVEKKVVKKEDKNMEQSTRKIIAGTVVSVKMQNTVIVAVTRKVAHKRYGKLLKVTKRFKVDSNGMELAVGDNVKIEQTKPISKTKFFKVIAKGDKN